MEEMSKKQLHVALFPWLAMGHINPYIHLSNQLAKRGHRISILIPQKAVLRLGTNNHYPNLIKFYPLPVPHVQGLPPGVETASDIDLHDNDLLAIAFDAMSDPVELLLLALKPNLVLYDAAYWIPNLAPVIGFKTVCYMVVGASGIAQIPPGDGKPTEQCPSDAVKLRRGDLWSLRNTTGSFGAISAQDRFCRAFQACDFISIRTCRELEGAMCDYMSRQYNKPVVLTGPILPETPECGLEEKWAEWLSRFESRSVVYCAFGSQHILQKNQFQELVLGFEMTGLPFLLALSKPKGANSLEEALPEGFSERVGDRGVVHEGWVQQTQILNHPSVGCFVGHCGFGSMWESLFSDAQIVLVPWLPDQILNTRLLSEEIKVAVEVERGGDGWVSKEDLCKAIKSAMDGDSEVGNLIKKNHSEWKKTLSSPGFMDNYVDDFVKHLNEL
ncbi:UDP-glycosyltransferase 79B9-like [Henckelia pumila]|uniref:UDP-glycosyltransferase 79B9-like n=1 Tax=Henckelia pumila TaxID=405737 RepID=UPI003C6E4338